MDCTTNVSSSTSAASPEAGVEVTERPFLERLPHRQPPGLAFIVGEVFGRPLHRFKGRRGRALRAGSRRGWWSPGVPAKPRVGAAWPEAVERIDDKGKRLEIDLDGLDRFSRGGFVHGGDGQNRFARVERLVRQRLLRAIQIGHVISGEDGLDARHGASGAGIDAAHARVGHRAQEQFGEEHPLRAEVLCVFGAAGHLGDVVRRNVVAADEFRVRHWAPSACSPHPPSMP